MDFNDFNTGKNDIGRRIDKVIRIFAKDLALSEVYKLIRKGLIKVNSKKIKSDYKIQENDIINIASFIFDNKISSKNHVAAKTSNISMPEIIFENEHILILNKPYDMLVHGNENSLDKIVFEYYKNKHNDSSLSFKPGPLHRIDKKTTGLIAFSMSIEGARWFTENIKNHSIKKIYFGIIEGELKVAERWEDEIKREENKSNNQFHTVLINEGCSNSDYNNCITNVNPIQCGALYNKTITFVKFDIETGRTHQIRAQSSLHGHPLLGDTAYGGTTLPDLPQDFFLQASKLIFPQNNPLGLPEVIEIPPSENLSNLLKVVKL